MAILTNTIVGCPALKIIISFGLRFTDNKVSISTFMLIPMVDDLQIRAASQTSDLFERFGLLAFQCPSLKVRPLRFSCHRDFDAHHRLRFARGGSRGQSRLASTAPRWPFQEGKDTGGHNGGVYHCKLNVWFLKLNLYIKSFYHIWNQSPLKDGFQKSPT